MPDIESLRSAILHLPPAARADLAHDLLVSLDGVPDENWETSWATEIAARSEAYRNGTAKTLDWR
jgi:hypothetical protein